MKLKTKTLLMIVVPVFLLFSLTTGYLSFTLYKNEKKAATSLAESLSKEYGNKIKVELEIALDAARTISDMSSGFIEMGDADRRAIDLALKQVLVNNSNFYGVWVGFEPNAFDDKDMEYINQEGHDSTGRFIPYWYRNGNEIKKAHLESYEEDGAGDYYLTPFNTGKETIMEPFEYEINGKNVLITSLTVPIKNNGKIIGVAGIDITLDKLQKLVNDLSIYQTGFGRLISNKGLVVTHPDNERIMKMAGEFESGEAKDIFEKINRGEVFSKYTYSASTKREMFKSFAPISIGNTNTYWFFGTVIPEEEIFKDLNKTVKLVVSISLLSLIVLIIAIYFVTGSITKPIGDITERLNELANFDFTYTEDTKAIKHLKRKDEIGQMTKALRLMRDNIVVLLKNITKTSETVASASEELTATSQYSATASEEVAKTIEEIARGASEQAGNTENSAENVENMGKLIEEDGRYVENLNLAAKKIEKQKEEGFIILKDLIDKTNRSNDAAKTIYETVISNNESAEKIEDASSMIQSIADQTNLLALNAAIEAARAGENGRGFAVVAEEIRKLAEESNNFTEEIKTVIKELKTKSQDAVDVMNEVKQIVDSQTESVKATEQKFDMIASSIEVTNDIIEKLNESAGLMHNNKNKLVDLMQNLSAIAEENAAGTEEASASMEEQAASIEEIANASEGLAHMAQELQASINKFKF